MPHIALPEGAPRHHRRLRLPPRNRQAHARARRGPAARAEHPHPWRARADRDVRLQPQRLLLLPDQPRSRRRGTSRRASHLVDEVKRDFQNAGVSAKLKALLEIAGQVQQGGRRHRRRRRTRARSRRNRSRNPRHRADRRGLLHVQPLRRRTRDLATARPGDVRQMGEHLARGGIYSRRWSEPEQEAVSSLTPLLRRSTPIDIQMAETIDSAPCGSASSVPLLLFCFPSTKRPVPVFDISPCTA